MLATDPWLLIHRQGWTCVLQFCTVKHHMVSVPQHAMSEVALRKEHQVWQGATASAPSCAATLSPRLTRYSALRCCSSGSSCFEYRVKTSLTSACRVAVAWDLTAGASGMRSTAGPWWSVLWVGKRYMQQAETAPGCPPGPVRASAQPQHQLQPEGKMDDLDRYRAQAAPGKTITSSEDIAAVLHASCNTSMQAVRGISHGTEPFADGLSCLPEPARR